MIPPNELTEVRQQRMLLLKNTSQTDLPAHSLAQITQCVREGSANGDYRAVHYVQPTSYGGIEDLVAVGGFAIEAGKYGIGTNDFPAYVKYSGGTVPTVGEVMGLEDAETTLMALDRGGFLVTEVDTALNLVRVMKMYCEIYIMKTGSGGISARSGTTPGKATDCTFIRLVNDELVAHSAPNGKTVYNLAASGAVGDEVYIVAMRETISGTLLAIWEDC